MKKVFLALLLALVALPLLAGKGGARPPATPVGLAVDAELEIERIIAKKEMAKIFAYFSDRTRPPNHRARAVRAYFTAKASPLQTADRDALASLLKDAEGPVRMAGAQMVGDLKEQALSRQVLELAASDADQNVRLAALIAVRPWTRLTHLYFLEGALDSRFENVQAEAVRSIALLSRSEVQPALVTRIERLLAPPNPPLVRRAALDALKVWGRLEWETLRQIIADGDTADSLRIYAIELSDGLPEAVSLRAPTLIDLVNRETSINIGWWAFRRLRAVARNDRAFVGGLARLLGSTTQYNTATAEMAGFLRTVGMKAEYRQGGWKVGAK